jgi:hypothetical protein
MRVAGRRVEGSLPSLSILIDSITLAEVKLFSRWIGTTLIRE